LTSSFPIWIPFISCSCLIALARNSKIILNRSGKSEHACSLLFLIDGNSVSCSPFSIMLSLGLSYIASIMLRNRSSIHNFFRAFIMKGCWILSKVFSASIEMIVCILSLLLFRFCIMLMDLHMLNYPFVPEMKLMWSWCMIVLTFCWILFASILLRSFTSIFI
jgi:hypothetical protein